MNERNEGRPRGPRGFTLVETLVATGIIVLLVGLTVSAGAALARRADVGRTEDALRLLDAAVSEWSRSADRPIGWGPVEGESDVWSDRALVLIISEMLDVVRRTPGPREILAKIDPDLVHTYRLGETPPWIERDYDAPYQLEPFAERGSITILDAWGWPIYATHPGALARPGAAVRDEDGTERTINEELFGVARHRAICFVSAGPDGLFGIEPEFYRVPAEERAAAMKAARADNVNSYPPHWPDEGG